jgi:hypothetical protein
MCLLHAMMLHFSTLLHMPHAGILGFPFLFVVIEFTPLDSYTVFNTLSNSRCFNKSVEIKVCLENYGLCSSEVVSSWQGHQLRETTCLLVIDQK